MGLNKVLPVTAVNLSQYGKRFLTAIFTGLQWLELFCLGALFCH